MFDWIPNMPLKGVLQNSCYQRSFTKSLKKIWKEKLLISFFLWKKSSMLENCIFIKSAFIQRYFSRIFLLSGWSCTYLAENLVMTASKCSWFINVRTVLFLEWRKQFPPFPILLRDEFDIHHTTFYPIRI